MATIKDIAEKANVSLSTVSLIINGKASERKISRETEERVLKIMREMNYIPNISAKTMRSGATPEYILALFCSFDFRNTMMTRLLYGVQNMIDLNQDRIKVIIYPYQSGHLSKEHSHFSGAEFHAAIIANADAKDLNYLKNHQFVMPIILYNRLLENYPSVNVNDKEIGRIAALHLYEQGYRHPAIVTSTQTFPGASHRNRAFVEQLKKLDIDIPKNYIYIIGPSVRDGAQFAEQLLSDSGSSGGLPDSFWCFSDSIALGLLNAFSARNIKIPEDIGVISVGSIESMFARYNHPSLTVIDIPIEKMGEGCYQFIKENRQASQPQAAGVFYETKLYVRDSTNRKRNQTSSSSNPVTV